MNLGVYFVIEEAILKANYEIEKLPLAFFLKIAFGASNRLNFFYLRDLGFNENALYVYLLSVSVFFGVFPESVNTFFFF